MLKSILSALLALTWLVMLAPMSAQAEIKSIEYKPGVLESAIKRGETVLVHYKTTW